MNIVKQSIISTVAAYAGTVLGMLNRIVLYPLSFAGNDADYWGLIDLYIGIATVLSSIGLLGMPSVLLKFLPNNKLNGDKIQSLAFRFFLIGGFITLSLVLFFRQGIAGATEMPMLFDDYYSLFILILVSLFLFEWSSQKLIAAYRAHIPVVFNQLIIRSFILILLILKWHDIISIDQFLLMISGGYMIVFGVMYFISWRKKIHGVVGAVIEKNQKSEIFSFSTFSILSGSGVWVFGQLDLILVGIALPFANVAFLGLSKNIINLITVPIRSLSQVFAPVISDLSRNQKKDSLQRIYKKSSFTFSFVGVLFFLGIWANVEWVLAYLSSKLNIDQAFSCMVLLLGISKLIDFSTGLSGVIINMSKHYRWALYFNVLSMLIMVGLGFVFLQWYGLIGIVMAHVFTTTVLNVCRAGLLRFKLGLWPYTYDHLPILLLLVIGVTLFSISLTETLWFDTLIRNTLLLVAIPFLIRQFGNDDLKRLLKQIFVRLHISTPRN